MIEILREAGLSAVVTDDGKLRVSPANRITDELRAFIKTNAKQIRALLLNQQPDAGDTELQEEREAIIAESSPSPSRSAPSRSSPSSPSPSSPSRSPSVTSSARSPAVTTHDMARYRSPLATPSRFRSPSSSPAHLDADAIVGALVNRGTGKRGEGIAVTLELLRESSRLDAKRFDAAMKLLQSDGAVYSDGWMAWLTPRMIKTLNIAARMIPPALRSSAIH